MTRVAALAGASGFVGRALTAALRADGYETRLIGRAGVDARWDDEPSVHRAVDGADLLVNLAGRSVDCRYTDRNRNEIHRSRVVTTRTLHAAVAAASAPPSLWVNASTATIYRYALDRPQGEDDGDVGTGFSVDVARDWEAAFFAGALERTRRGSRTAGTGGSARTRPVTAARRGTVRGAVSGSAGSTSTTSSAPCGSCATAPTSTGRSTSRRRGRATTGR